MFICLDTQHMNSFTHWMAFLISEGNINNVHNPFHYKTVTKRSIYFKIDMTKT